MLGSAPGITSLREVEYYAHPRNAFWDIVEAVLEIPRDVPYPQRTARLAGAGVALWDVLAACERPSSLDSDIVEATIVPNDIAGLLRTHPTIRHVLFNGGKAAAAFRKYVRPTFSADLNTRLSMTRLPSTSPAYAAMRPAAKCAAWAVLSEWIES